MARIDYVFKTVSYGTQAVNLAATVHLPAQTSSVKGIGEMLQPHCIASK
jgi:hypothetical protein